LKRQNSNQCNASLSDMFEYFKNTNSDTHVNVANLLGQNEVSNDFVNCDNFVLNNDISIEEIEKAVKNPESINHVEWIEFLMSILNARLPK